MSGYAKSVVFPASSTLPELVDGRLRRASRPELRLQGLRPRRAAALPWLVAVGGGGSGGSAHSGLFAAVALFLTYIWTDFPMSYAMFGMVPYLLAIPLGLVATGAFVRYCERGGFRWWLLSAFLMVVGEAVHLTFAMVVVPAAAAVYLASAVRRSPDKDDPAVHAIEASSGSG